MTKITFSPTKELVVHDIIRIDLDDMLRGRVTPAGTMPLYWCNGIIFAFSSLPLSDEVVADYLKGTVHWLEVQYASLPDYKPVLSLSEEEYKTAMNIRVIDTSKSQLHNELTTWLKTVKT